MTLAASGGHCWSRRRLYHMLWVVVGKLQVRWGAQRARISERPLRLEACACAVPSPVLRLVLVRRGTTHKPFLYAKHAKKNSNSFDHAN